MEIHGVKLFFRRERAYPEPEPYDRASCGKAPAKAQETWNRNAQSLPVRKLKPLNSRQRRSARRLAELCSYEHKERVDQWQLQTVVP